MITRKLGKLLRGDATPFQLMAATLIGAVIGFLPGFGAAPGLFLSALLLLILLNANLFLAGLTIAGATLLSYLLLPVSYQLGRLLVDGPTSGLFTWAINAPGLAWFGFEVYVVSGGLVLSILVGLLLGWLVVRTVATFRRKIHAMQNGSEAYRAWMEKPYVKAGIWLFFGSGSKKSLEELESKRMGKVLRPLGLFLVVGCAVLLVILSLLFQDSIVTTNVRSALERVNRATVDLDRMSISFGSGAVVVEGLAVVDRDDLMRNAFSAERVTAAVSLHGLLRKKVVIDTLEVVDARVGEERRFPGQRIGRDPRPEPTPPERTDDRSLEDYVSDAQQWRDRLLQVREWVDRFVTGETAEAEEEVGLSLAERLRERAEALGYAAVRAEHRIAREPTVTIREMTADGVRVNALPDERLRISGLNLSTQPHLLADGPELSVQAESDLLRLRLAGPGADSQGSQIEMRYRDLPVDTVRGWLKDAPAFPLEGGTMTLDAAGSFSTANLNLPVAVQFQQTQVLVPGVGATAVDSLTIPVTLHGTLDSPRLQVSTEALQAALVEAGRGAVARELEQRAGDALRDRIPGGVLGGGSDSDEESSEQSRDAAGDAVRGLFGR